MLACFEVAAPLGYLPDVDPELRRRFDHVLGTLVRLVGGHGGRGGGRAVTAVAMPLPTGVHQGAVMQFAPGTFVTPSVRLVRLLGRGGMGTVWVAEHLALGTEVAVKLISAEAMQQGGPVLLERFWREAQAAARIKNPHVVQTHDLGAMPDGTPYIVMELLEGESLGQRLARTQILSLDEAALIVVQIAKALGAAHKLGIVHRDIKPDNVFLVSSHEELCSFRASRCEPAWRRSW